MSGRKGGKFNKTKRGGERTFTNFQTDPSAAVASQPKTYHRDASPSSSSESDQEKKNENKIDSNEIQNVNRMPVKNLKLGELSLSDSNNDQEPKSDNLSRREREAIEAQRKKEAYMKATMEGKTDQAKSDLARLALIRKQREEAAKKRLEEEANKKKVSGAKGDSLNAGKGIISKSLGGK